MLTESRRAALYTLRLLAGSVLTVWLAGNWLVASASSAAVGAVVFQQLSYAIYIAIWLSAPFLTGDCLSKEKREGTLGLLFLTPLTALQIVVGKSLVHGLRALSLLFAAAPIIAVPYLMGGVAIGSILWVLTVELSALALALGAGLLASAITRQRRWSFAQTILWTCAFAVIHFQIVNGALRGVIRLRFGGLLFGSALVFVLIVLAAAWRLRSEWQDKPLSKRQIWWLQTFCSPVFWRSLFQASMRRELNRNPIAWLQYYSTWDRVAKLVWCGLALMIDTHLFTALHRIPQEVLGLEALFAAALAYTAASSFRRERQNGAFELILVSPIARNQIIAGRLRAIRAQFFPAAILLFMPWPLLGTMFGGTAFDLERLALLQCGFIWTTYWSLPVVGLYFALSSRNFFRALSNTFFLGLILPFALTQLGPLLISARADLADACVLAMMAQLAACALLSPWLTPLIRRGAAAPARV